MLIPCPYGGGESCLRQGGDGAVAHGVQFKHKFPHVAELGGGLSGGPMGVKSKKAKYGAQNMSGPTNVPSELSAPVTAESMPQPDVSEPIIPDAAPVVQESPLGTPFVSYKNVPFLKPTTMVHKQNVTLKTGFGTDTGQVVGYAVNGSLCVKTSNGGYTAVNPANISSKESLHADNSIWAGLTDKSIMTAPTHISSKFDQIMEDTGPAGVAPKEVVSTLNSHGYHALLVGGIVRDMLAGKVSKDVDIVTNAPWQQMEQLVGKSNYLLNNAPYVALIQLGKNSDKASSLDITSFRAADQWPGESGTGVGGGQKLGGCIATDSNSRDFACNTLMYDPVNKMIIDPTGRGIHEAKNKLLSPSFTEGGKDVWLGNNRLGIRLCKMLMKGYQMTDELKAVYTPEVFAKHMKSFQDDKGLAKMAAWTVRQICSDITKENGWSQLPTTSKVKAIERLVQFKKVVYDAGFGEVYKQYIGPSLLEYTQSWKLAGE